MTDSLIQLLENIIGTLDPISQQDWHGKWRIHSAIELAQKARAIANANLSPDRTVIGKAIRRAILKTWNAAQKKEENIKASATVAAADVMSFLSQHHKFCSNRGIPVSECSVCSDPAVMGVPSTKRLDMESAPAPANQEPESYDSAHPSKLNDVECNFHFGSPFGTEREPC